MLAVDGGTFGPHREAAAWERSKATTGERHAVKNLLA